MERICIYFLLVTMFLNGFAVNIYCQDDFRKALEYFEKGDYIMTDTLLNRCIKEDPTNINVRFNLAVVKLYLKDTCTFCNELFRINFPFEEDKKALKLFHQFCASTDTIYYDKNFEATDQRSYRYYEVIERHLHNGNTIGRIYDLRPHMITVIKTGHILPESIRTHLIASYTVIENGNKVFGYVNSIPEYRGGMDALARDIISSEYYSSTKSLLNNNDLVFLVYYRVDKNGVIRDPVVASTDNDFVITEELKKNINNIYSGLTGFKPANILGNNIDSYLCGTISFGSTGKISASIGIPLMYHLDLFHE